MRRGKIAGGVAWFVVYFGRELALVLAPERKLLLKTQGARRKTFPSGSFPPGAPSDLLTGELSPVLANCPRSPAAALAPARRQDRLEERRVSARPNVGLAACVESARLTRPDPADPLPSERLSSPPDVLELSSAPADEAVQAAVPSVLPAPPARKRTWPLALVLFLLTCFSTFWSGAFTNSRLDLTPWIDWGVADLVMLAVSRWDMGLEYMLAIMGILLAHEMGHFVTARWYRIPASLPYFIPMPLSPFGTMGAVILMHGRQADRKQLFDVGLAGPLAGLLVCLPVLYVGIGRAVPDPQPVIEFHQPLLMQGLVAWLRPELSGKTLVMSPLLMAGWLGLLITGLNMLPVSQLDGGHVCYALLGRRAHLVARALFVAAVTFMFLTGRYTWLLLMLLILLIGLRHPPTRDDTVPLGWVRAAVGWLSLLIPVVCFNPLGITVHGF